MFLFLCFVTTAQILNRRHMDNVYGMHGYDSMSEGCGATSGPTAGTHGPVGLCLHQRGRPIMLPEVNGQV